MSDDGEKVGIVCLRMWLLGNKFSLVMHVQPVNGEMSEVVQPPELEHMISF